MNLQSANSSPVSSFLTTSTSYVDLLGTSGGSPVSISITKAAGTSLLIRGNTSVAQPTTTDTVTLGVNDGTTDTDLARNRIVTSPATQLQGEVILSGLGAGTFTLKLRVKNSGGTNSSFGTSSSITVMEIDPGTMNVVNSNVFYATGYSINSTSFTNVLTTSGGAAISVAITKASGSTKLLVSAGTTCNTAAANNTPTLAVNDGATDWSLGSNRVFSGVQIHELIAGSVMLTGLSAGAKTITLRVKGSAANNITFNNTNSAYLTVQEVP